MIVDLHCHTTASDGSLSPAELVSLARERNIDLLAITDHDTLEAYDALVESGKPSLITGVELSCQWHKRGIHLVGLNVNRDSHAMADAMAHQHKARNDRAGMIAERLEKYGVESPLAGARKEAAGELVGRPHFARYLVACGFVKSEKDAFKKFLGSGKPCDIKVCWPETRQVVEWIRGAGGVAVLAHPGKYSFTRSRLISYLEEFKDCGGQAIEIYSGPQHPDQTKMYFNLCDQFHLCQSIGSDFHSPAQRWLNLGVDSDNFRLSRPVWEQW